MGRGAGDLGLAGLGFRGLGIRPLTQNLTVKLRGVVQTEVAVIIGLFPFFRAHSILAGLSLAPEGSMNSGFSDSFSGFELQLWRAVLVLRFRGYPKP